MATTGASSAPPSPSPSPAAQRSLWQSPVPYLFGGLSATVGLIAFALLILACSYSKLFAARGPDGGGRTDLEADGGGSGAVAAPPPVLEEKYLVVMAGQEEPTFLAIATSSRASSFGSRSTVSTGTSEITLSSGEY